MNILFISEGFAPYVFSENIVNSKLVLAFLKKGWNVTVISKREDGKVYSEDWNDWELLKNITNEIKYKKSNFFEKIEIIKKIKYPIHGIRWAYYAYKKALELNKQKKFDVVISRSPSDTSHLPAYLFTKEINTKWIANWNDPAYHIWPSPYNINIKLLKKKTYDIYVKQIIKSTDVNTFPSLFLKELFEQKMNIKISNYSIIPHISYCEDKNIKFNELKRNKDNTIKICHAGNLSKERNPEKLFAALKDFIKKNKINLRLDFLGVMNDEINVLIKKYKLENIVNFIGNYSYSESLKKMAEYDILLLIEAVTDEPVFLPSKLVDYTQLNKLILSLSSNESVVCNLLKKYNSGICGEIKSKESIIKALNKAISILKNENKYNLIIKNTQQMFVNEFYYETVLSKYEKIFKDLL